MSFQVPGKLENPQVQISIVVEKLVTSVFACLNNKTDAQRCGVPGNADNEQRNVRV
jgi:hypothetical protein